LTEIEKDGKLFDIIIIDGDHSEIATVQPLQAANRPKHVLAKLRASWSYT